MTVSFVSSCVSFWRASRQTSRCVVLQVKSVGTAPVPTAEGDTKDVTASQEAASEQSSGGRR